MVTGREKRSVTIRSAARPLGSAQGITGAGGWILREVSIFKVFLLAEAFPELSIYQYPVPWCSNTILGNLKTAIEGTYHAFKFEKYIRRYLSEFQYRFNRRFDLSTIFPRLLLAGVKTGGTPGALVEVG